MKISAERTASEVCFTAILTKFLDLRRVLGVISEHQVRWVQCNSTKKVQNKEEKRILESLTEWSARERKQHKPSKRALTKQDNWRHRCKCVKFKGACWLGRDSEATRPVAPQLALEVKTSLASRRK